MSLNTALWFHITENLRDCGVYTCMHMILDEHLMNIDFRFIVSIRIYECRRWKTQNHDCRFAGLAIPKSQIILLSFSSSLSIIPSNFINLDTVISIKCVFEDKVGSSTPASLCKLWFLMDTSVHIQWIIIVSLQMEGMLCISAGEDMLLQIIWFVDEFQRMEVLDMWRCLICLSWKRRRDGCFWISKSIKILQIYTLANWARSTVKYLRGETGFYLCRFASS